MASTFKPLTRLVLYIGSNPWTRRAVRVLTRPFRFRGDLRLRARGRLVSVNSVDRLAAALMWKYSLLAVEEELLCAARIKPGMTVLEIGANIGFLTTAFSELVGESGRVIAFEPDADNFRLLEKNLADNGRKNVTCVRKAVSESTGKGRLFISEEHRGDHRIFDSSDGRPSVEIETAAIDDFLPPGTKVDFIKMDVQGAEYSALCGMERTLRGQEKTAMLCEFSPSLLRRAGADPALFLARLRELGFRLNLVDEDHNRVVPALEQELLACCRGEEYLNLLLEKGTVG